jgi:SAM-dependent methyltransferase
MDMLRRFLNRQPPAKAPMSLADYILSYCGEAKPAQDYARVHLGRLVRTIEITPPGSSADRILEMGAYMQITPALKTRLGYGEVRGCYLGPLGVVDDKHATSSSGEAFSCKIDLFNAEKDRYPYPDGHFATVICCELLEHLELDPMHMAAEWNRILRDGGYLVLSTPNICSLRSISNAITGHHPGLFSQYVTPLPGADTNRHQREYAPGEVALLLDAAGFSVGRMETGPYGLERPSAYDWVLDLLKQRGASLDLRDDTIHAVARKTGPVKDRYPSWLYV